MLVEGEGRIGSPHFTPLVNACEIAWPATW
jgi:hypothetical protein